MDNLLEELNTLKNKNKEVPKKKDLVTITKIENKEKELTPKEKFEAKLEEIYGKDTIVLPKKEEDYTTKTAMEEVYGDKANKHLDYRIVNRTARFKENTCQRINSATGKIVDTTKSIADKITKPFRYLRDNMKNDVKRQELQKQIDEIRASSRVKKETLTRIKIKDSSGYVGTVAITIMGVIVLAGIIFMGIGSIINR